MRHFLLLFAIFLLVNYHNASGQVIDDFSDGNFSEKPVWIGNSANFQINADGELQLSAPAAAGQSYLSTSSEIINNAVWEFKVRLEFNPSSSNYIDIYLVSDEADLSGMVNGYFVRVGNTQDEVSLYKQSGDKSSLEKIIDGVDDRVDASTIELNIKVTKNTASEWELLVDTSLDKSYVLEGTAVDNEHYLSRYFGIRCNYTSTRSTKFYFDNLFIIGDPFTDEIAPSIDSLVVLSDSTIQLHFSEKMNAEGLAVPINYFVNNAIGYPSTIKIKSDTSVLLMFNHHFEDKILNEISVHGLSDLFGNPLDETKIAFTYFAPYLVKFGDVIISEIMADPTPGVDLPEYEYLEIYNRYSNAIRLEKVKLVVGQDTTFIPDVDIHSGEYIILCQHAAVPHFEKLGNTIKVPNWPSLNNRGEQIVLFNKINEVIHAVTYLDSWYYSIEKDDGGYSLELIDSGFPCIGKENWMASNDPSGGTPGRPNSHHLQLTDLTAPTIDRIIPQNEQSLVLYLSENIGPQSISSTDLAITPELSIQHIQLIEPGFSEIRVGLGEIIQTKATYQLTLKNISDCSGNTLKEASKEFVLPEAADSLDLLINEILFNPRANGVDFVEIYNQSDKFIDLHSVSLNVETLSPALQEHLVINPGQFIALTEDPNVLNNQYPNSNMNVIFQSDILPSYNNDEGEVYLLNSQGEIIDFLHYNEDFHSDFLADVEGVSLERISYNQKTNDRNNWQSAASIAGFATPGKINSQYLDLATSNEEITVEPKVFSPGNDGFHDFTTISCRFPTAGQMASIQILDAAGRHIKTILDHQSIGPEASFKWEGLNDQGEEVRMGPYIVFIEIYHSNGNIRHYREKVVVGGAL